MKTLLSSSFTIVTVLMLVGVAAGRARSVFVSSDQCKGGGSGRTAPGPHPAA